MKIPSPKNVASLASCILSDDCKSIAILTGAGVSVASGIPDFRSPGGMYDTLRPELITCSDRERRLMSADPTFVVSWHIFQQNAFPYLEVRRPFILGTAENRWKATIAHRFMELLHTKTGKLTRIYTQNIDGLDQQCTAIPAERIVPVHGTLARVACEGCQTRMEFSEFCQKLSLNPPRFFSEAICRLIFFQCIEQDLPTVDLLIVAGTSLVVSPANSVVYKVPDTTQRVIVNMEQVGADLGIEYGHCKDSRDWFLQGTCDKIFLELIQHLGWTKDLDVNVLPKASADLVKEAREADKG